MILYFGYKKQAESLLNSSDAVYLLISLKNFWGDLASDFKPLADTLRVTYFPVRGLSTLFLRRLGRKRRLVWRME